MKPQHSPTKEQIREWLLQRRGTRTPPPDLPAIRNALWPGMPMRQGARTGADELVGEMPIAAS